jgi:hypothetical protein
MILTCIEIKEMAEALAGAATESGVAIVISMCQVATTKPQSAVVTNCNVEVEKALLDAALSANGNDGTPEEWSTILQPIYGGVADEAFIKL